MPRVKVKFLGVLPGGDGEVKAELELPPGSTVFHAVEALAKRLSQRLGKDFSASKILARHVVMLNGVSLEGDKLLTARVMDEDNITIFLPVSGG